MTFEEWCKDRLTMDGYPQYTAEDAWQASRRAALEEAALRVAIHSQYPITTDFDRGYDKARKDAANSIRALAASDSDRGKDE